MNQKLYPSLANQDNAPIAAPWKNESLGQRAWRVAMGMRSWIFLALLAAISWWLYLQVQDLTRYPAHVLSRLHVVGAPMEGPLAELLVEKGSHVKKGQVLARMDDRLHTMELKLATLEKERIEQEIIRTALQFQLSQMALQTRLLSFVNEAQTSLLTGQAKQNTTSAELRALNKELKWLQRVRQNQLGRPNNLGTLQARQKSLQAMAAAMPRLMRLYRQKQQRARKLYTKLKPFEGKQAKSQVEKILRPLQVQWAMQTYRIKKLELQRDFMTLRAPISGTVQEVLQRPGARLLQGNPVLKIVRENRRLLIAYVEETIARRVQLGMKVRAVLRFPHRRSVWEHVKPHSGYCAQITAVGTIEPIPLRFRIVPQRPTWVRPVTIQLLQPQELIPGEMMFIDFSANQCNK